MHTKEQLLTKKILNWYDLNKRSLPWRKDVSFKKKQYYTLVSEFMLQQTQVVTVIPYFKRFIKFIPNLNSLAKVKNEKLIKLWEGLGYYSRARNLKKTAQLIIKNFKGNLPNNFDDLTKLPGIGNYTASAILAIVFNRPYIPLDGNIERVLKRYLYLKKENEIKKDYIIKKKTIFGISSRSGDYAQALMELGALICKPTNPLCNQCPISNKCKSLQKKDFDLTKSIKKNIFGKSLRSSDYAQALMELGALICKPTNPICNECPISKNCKSYKKKDFNLIKITKKNIEKYFILKVYKKNQSYLLIKNTKFNFLKNLSIFPMEELSNPKNFNENLNFKMSNMNMNIKIQYLKFNQKFPSSYWIDKKKLDSYMLPSFTKKVVQYLEKN